MTSDDAWLGLRDPDSLVLEPPSAAADWARPPYVALAGDDLEFWWASVTAIPGGYRAELDAKLTEAAPGLLERFVALADAQVGTLFRFASDWGALNICTHRLPRAHPPLKSAPRSTYQCNETRRPDGVDHAVAHLESIEAWRYVSRRMRTILEIAEGLRRDPVTLGSADAWSRLHREPPSTPGDARAAVAGAVNLLVQLAQVRPWASPEPPYIRVGGHDLLGALASQLLLATARVSGWAVCSNCASPYVPTRRPQAGRLNYCPRCRAEGVPNRTAAQNLRARRRHAERGR